MTDGLAIQVLMNDTVMTPQRMYDICLDVAQRLIGFDGQPVLNASPSGLTRRRLRVENRSNATEREGPPHDPPRSRARFAHRALDHRDSVLAVGPAAQAACDPFTTPVYAGNAPSPQDVLGFPLGSQEVTDHQIVTYLSAIDAGSDRGDHGTGRDLGAGAADQVRDRRQALERDAVRARDAPRRRCGACAIRRSRRPGGCDRAEHAADPVARRQRARHGGERRRRGAPGALRPRRPHRLRREGDHVRFAWS